MKCTADMKLLTRAYLAILTSLKMTVHPSHSSHEHPLLDSLEMFSSHLQKVYSIKLSENMLYHSKAGMTLKAGVTSMLTRQLHTQECVSVGWRVGVKQGSSPQPKQIGSTQKMGTSLKTKRCADPNLKMTFFQVHKLLRRGSMEKELSLGHFFQDSPVKTAASTEYFHLNLTGQGCEKWCG